MRAADPSSGSRQAGGYAPRFWSIFGAWGFLRSPALPGTVRHHGPRSVAEWEDTPA
jgi:hypothetical protein